MWRSRSSVLPTERLVGADHLLVEGLDLGREEAVQAEHAPFLVGEGGALVEQRDVEEVLPPVAGQRHVRVRFRSRMAPQGPRRHGSHRRERRRGRRCTPAQERLTDRRPNSAPAGPLRVPYGGGPSQDPVDLLVELCESLPTRSRRHHGGGCRERGPRGDRVAPARPRVPYRGLGHRRPLALVQSVPPALCSRDAPVRR